MKSNAINDQEFLADVQSGQIQGLDVVCPKVAVLKFDRTKRPTQGLLTKSDAQNFADAVLESKTATWLDFTMNKQEDGALALVLKPFMHCPNFGSLCIQVVGANANKVIVSDADIDVLAELISKSNSLTVLNLFALKLTPSQQLKIITACIQSQSLDKISLSRGVYTEGGIPKETLTALGQLLSQSTKLKSIDFHNFSLSPSDLQFLLQNLAQNEQNNLAELILGMNPLGSSGLKTLVTFIQLPVCRLQKIDIGSTVTPDDTAEDFTQALCGIIGGNTPLKSLTCTHLRLGINSLEAVTEALKNNHHLTHLDLSNNAFLGSQQLRAIPAMSQVSEVAKTLFAEIDTKLKSNQDHSAESIRDIKSEKINK